MTYTYDLLSEPWIPCLRADGSRLSLGLRDTLVRSHELAEIQGETPLVTAALYRLLLALLHRVYGPEDEEAWSDLWETGRWDAAPLDAYLDQWRDRFDLFHPEHPFMQMPDDRVKAKSVASLLPHVASGHNATLFDHHVGDMSLALSPAEAARALLAVRAFGLAGLSGLEQKFTDAACCRGIIFLAEGDSLFESLCLNLTRHPWDRRRASFCQDRPAWEVADPTQPDRDVPLGELDYLTWPTRRVLLCPTGPTSRPTVCEMTMAPALRLNATVTNPMQYYRVRAKGGPRVLRFNESRALWRDSALLLRVGGEESRPARVLEWLAELVAQDALSRERTLRFAALGMANNQAKVDFYRSEHLPLPLDYLSRRNLVEVLEEALELADKVGRHVWAATRVLAKFVIARESDLPNAHQPTSEDVGSLAGQWAVERGYWSRLELPFRKMIVDLPHDAAACRETWRGTLRATAWQAFDAVAETLEASPQHMKAVVRARDALALGLYKALDSGAAVA